ITYSILTYRPALRSLHTIPTRRSSDLLPQLASCALTNSPSCSGLLAITSAANPAIFSLISGLASDFLTSADSLSTMSFGVPAGEIGRHTSELQSRENLVCRFPLEKKK